MAHDVFISYSSKDKPIADAVCANLEGHGLRCWIAPRDIVAGEDWPSAITKAIAQSRVMVLVFSANSNASDDVGRELMLAANCRLVIVPFKIENIEPEPGKQYYLARTHWLDAINPPTKEQIHELVDCVGKLIPTQRPAPAQVEPAPVPPAITPLAPVTTAVPPKEKSQVQRKKLPLAWIVGGGGLLLIGMVLVLLFVTHTITLPSPPARAAANTPSTSKPTSAPPTKAGPTPTLDFSAKAGMTGVRVYNRPSDSSTELDFTFNNMTILSQAYNCEWLYIQYEPVTLIKGWVKSSEITYNAKCADIPADQNYSGPDPAAPTRSAGTGQCDRNRYFNIDNATGYPATLTLYGPDTFDFDVPTGISTFNICAGTYNYTFLGGCGPGVTVPVTGSVSSGGSIRIYCN